MEKQIKTMNIFQLLAARLSKGKKVAPFILAGFLVFAFPIVSAALDITVTQGANGTITPGGTVTVANGASQTFTIQPNTNSFYTIRDVVVDGSNTGVSSPWTDLGPQGNNIRIRSFVYLGNGVVVASGETMLRSTDYGMTWTNLGPMCGVKILTLKYAGTYNGQQIVLGGGGYLTGGGLILRSTDGGQTWTCSPTLYNQQTIDGLASLGNGLVLAGTYPNGLILRSTDYGATWTNMGELGAENDIISIESFDNGIVVAGSGTYGDIWRSTDNGNTWTNLGNQAGEKDIDYIANMGNGIAIGSAYPDGKLIRSTDFGATWTDLGIFDGKIMNNLSHMGNGMGVVGGGSIGHMWKTVDYGATWMDLGQQGGEQWITVGYLENGIFLAGTGALINQGGTSDGKILRSTASGLGPTTTYTFNNVQASHTISADFISVPPALTINSFTATPSSVAPGQPTTLNWDVSNATDVSISPLPANCTPTPPSGSCSDTPASTTVYTLTASSSTISLTAKATVQVVTPPIISNVSASVSSLTDTVTWTTDQPATEQVFYGTTTSFGSPSPVGTNLQTSHRMTFYNLPRKTTFYYQTYSTNAAGKTYSGTFSFTTSAKVNASGGVIITPGR